jgi:hypothetical protein
MLPTMMLAALVPCAVPGMDKETTAQEASELLRGKWAVVYRETNGAKEADFVRLVYTIEGHSITATVNGVLNGTGRVRLVPAGRYYSIVILVYSPLAFLL